MKLTLTISEVTSATGIGRTKLYELFKSGAIPARKLGVKTVVLRDDLENFLKNLDTYPSENGED